jgi:hypothetical protein
MGRFGAEEVATYNVMVCTGLLMILGAMRLQGQLELWGGTCGDRIETKLFKVHAKQLG